MMMMMMMMMVMIMMMVTAQSLPDLHRHSQGKETKDDADGGHATYLDIKAEDGSVMVNSPQTLQLAMEELSTADCVGIDAEYMPSLFDVGPSEKAKTTKAVNVDKCRTYDGDDDGDGSGDKDGDDDDGDDNVGGCRGGNGDGGSKQDHHKCVGDGVGGEGKGPKTERESKNKDVSLDCCGGSTKTTRQQRHRNKQTPRQTDRQRQKQRQQENKMNNKATLLQISTRRRTFLFDLMGFDDNMNTALKDLYERKDVIKIGYAFAGDLRVLRRSIRQATCFQHIQSYLELAELCAHRQIIRCHGL